MGHLEVLLEKLVLRKKHLKEVYGMDVCRLSFCAFQCLPNPMSRFFSKIIISPHPFCTSSMSQLFFCYRSYIFMTSKFSRSKFPAKVNSDCQSSSFFDAVPNSCGMGRVAIDWKKYRSIRLMEEIRRSPVEVGSSSHYLPGFIHSRWLFGISEPSTVGLHLFGSSTSIWWQGSIWLTTTSLASHWVKKSWHFFNLT